MEFFKGFIKTKNKMALQKWKDAPLLTAKQVRPFPECAGVIAEGYIVVDVDDLEQSKKLLSIIKQEKIKTQVIQTKRGKHFYFRSKKIKSNKTHTYLACGLVADIKSGSANSYVLIKQDGKERMVEYDEGIGELPCWLNPVNVKTLPFLTMKAGDGRNNALFSYKQYLARAGQTDSEIHQTIKIINNYIVKDPLPLSELKQVNRQEDFTAVRTKQQTGFRFNEFADELIEQEHIIKINNILHIYNDGIYSADINIIQKKMLERKPDLKDHNRREVLKYLDIMAQDKKDDCYNLIACNNGVFNLLTGELQDYTPDNIITNKINVNYNVNPKSKIMEKTLNDYACNNFEIYELILEMIGYCLYRRNELGKCFILLGDKQNGKSTLLKVISTIIGEQNISSLDINALGNRFSTALLHNKLINVGDDIADSYIKGDTMAIFKKIVTGETITAEFKGRDPFQFKPYCKLLFSANVLPKLKDFTEAGIRRMIIIPLTAKFTPASSSYDPYIIDKLTAPAELEWLLAYSLNALQTVLAEKKFSEGKKVKKEIEQYKKENNPTLEFFEEHELIKKLNGMEIKSTYNNYKKWAYENGVDPLKKQNFIKQVCGSYECTTRISTINGLTANRFYYENK